jgi:hypothetical protein
MAQDDYRIRIELPEERAAGRLLGRLHLDLGSEARRLAHELEGRRLVVSRDGNEVFVYAATPQEAEQARAVIENELREEGIEGRIGPVEQWLHDEERWTDEAPGPTFEEELLAEGYAPWEVRVELGSQAEARELAERLEEEGYGVARRYRYVIAGTETKEEAEALAEQLHGEVEPSSRLVWENVPQNPFVVFGGLGGSGTPL